MTSAGEVVREALRAFQREDAKEKVALCELDRAIPSGSGARVMRALHGTPGGRLRTAGAAERNAPLARLVPQRPKLYMLRCERHMIDFRVVDDGYEIVHVLHERSLPKKHL